MSHYNLTARPDREDIARAAQKRPSPSSGAKVEQCKATQTIERVDAVYNYRPLELAPVPLGVFHAVFPTFLFLMNELKDADLTDDDLSHARSFVELANQFYDQEYQRLEALRPSLQAAIHQDILAETALRFGDRSLRPDGRVRSISTPNGFEIIRVLAEGKNEIGLGGTDPIVQAECDYVAIYTSDKVRK